MGALCNFPWKENSKIKVLIYVAAELVAGRPDAQAVIMNHSDWWLRDDNGSVINNGDGHVPWVNYSVPSFSDWFSEYVPGWFGDETKELFDGLFVDASGYQPAAYRRVNKFVKHPSDYNAFFLAKMAMYGAAAPQYFQFPKHISVYMRQSRFTCALFHKNTVKYWKCCSN